jgi:hydroxyacylglutathione hydrolase
MVPNGSKLNAMLYSREMPQRLIHEILPVGILQCNCSIVGDPQTHEALVIDPGDEVDRVLEVLNRHELRVRAIVLTHAHIDHVGGLAKLHRATGAPVLMHRDDLELYRALPKQAAWLGVPTPEMSDVEGYLRDGDSLQWGRLSAQVIHTPGHSPGSISLFLPAGRDNAEQHNSLIQIPLLFAGDTLFAQSIGRTDLWGGSLDAILRSVHRKLLILPERTLVYPGHGPSTTIGTEKESNPFLLVR